MLEWYAGIKLSRNHKNFRRAPVYEPTLRESALFTHLNGQDLDLYEQAKKVFDRQREEYNGRKRS